MDPLGNSTASRTTTTFTCYPDKARNMATCAFQTQSIWINTTDHAENFVRWSILTLALSMSCLGFVAATVRGDDSAKTLNEKEPENTGLDVKYVGTEACIECHQSQYGSYLQTTHSQTAERTDPAKEPTGESFRNPLTGDEYQIATVDGQFIHRVIRFRDDNTPSGQTEVTVDYSRKRPNNC